MMSSALAIFPNFGYVCRSIVLVSVIVWKMKKNCETRLELQLLLIINTLLNVTVSDFGDKIYVKS